MSELEKYLPIGTVVLLKGAKKRVMIIGLCVAVGNNKEKVWDYSGCIYPEGLITTAQTCLFNHDQIEKIYHLGLIDQEEIEFKNHLNEFLEKMNKKEENN